MGNSIPSQKHANVKRNCSYSSTAHEANSTTTLHVAKLPINVDGCFMASSSAKRTDQYPSHLIPYEIASFRDLPAQDEEFFDSQAWLDSDCEDFVSVNDFTPSYGNSPIQQISLTESSKREESLTDESKFSTFPEPTSAPMKKQLIELLWEDFCEDDKQEKSEAKPLSFYCQLKYEGRLQEYNEVYCSNKNETTPNRENTASVSTNGCFPNLVKTFSFSERKKKLSHSGTVADSK